MFVKMKNVGGSTLSDTLLEDAELSLPLFNNRRT